MNLADLQQIKEREHAARKKIVLRCCMAAGCTSSDSKGVKERLEKAVAEAGLHNDVEVRGVGCMKLCCVGPLVQVDPAAALYINVTAENAPSIIDALKGGKAHVEQADPQSPFFAKQQSIVLANSGIIDPERIESYIAVDGYTALHNVLTEFDPKAVIETIVEQRPARSWRRGIPDRPQVGHRRQIVRSQEIRHLQRRRRRSRRVHGPQRPRERPAQRPRGHGHRRLRGRCRPRFHLCACRVSARHQPPADRDQTGQAASAC